MLPVLSTNRSGQSSSIPPAKITGLSPRSQDGKGGQRRRIIILRATITEHWVRRAAYPATDLPHHHRYRIDTSVHILQVRIPRLKETQNNLPPLHSYYVAGFGIKTRARTVWHIVLGIYYKPAAFTTKSLHLQLECACKSRGECCQNVDFDSRGRRQTWAAAFLIGTQITQVRPVSTSRTERFCTLLPPVCLKGVPTGGRGVWRRKKQEGSKVPLCKMLSHPIMHIWQLRQLQSQYLYSMKSLN